MNRKILHILLAESNQNCQLLFSQALKEIKIKTVLRTVNDEFKLMEYLDHPEFQLPNIIILNYSLQNNNGINCLYEIRRNQKFQNVTTAIYSHSDSDTFLEDAFVNGANIYFKHPYDAGVLKDILEHVCNINWQYATSGLQIENFMLSLNHIPQKSDAVLEDA